MPKRDSWICRVEKVSDTRGSIDLVNRPYGTFILCFANDILFKTFLSFVIQKEVFIQSFLEKWQEADPSKSCRSFCPLKKN